MGIRSGKGDDGFTDVLSGGRIGKDSLRIKALGDLDELLSYLGLVKCKAVSLKEKSLIEEMRKDVSAVGAFVADPSRADGFGRDKCLKINGILTSLEKESAAFKDFSFGEEDETAGFLNITRAVARRAERSIVELFREKTVRERDILEYINCMSDVLFLMASRRAGK
ncbi:MAG: ATP:cob(I)alamin adenosyltransferase [Candidatus Omnitrophota bacterium]|nr:ATP:cob(I)alamin adenosyltransferase [Candidatus Omnitrophota bacterium]